MAELSAMEGDDRALADELTPELRVPTAQVRKRITRARHVVRTMPRLLSAMESGELEAYGAGRVVKVTAPLSEADTVAVDAQLAEKLALGTATMWHADNLARHTRTIVETVDPGGQAARARSARTSRSVELVPGENATSSLVLTLPAEIASACYARLDALARARGKDDQRTMDQRRADFSADLLLGNDPGTAPPQADATVYLHMPVDTALGISDTGCELDGYGPVPAVIAREIMTNERSIWRAVLCDPGTGNPVDLGRTQRQPTEHIRTMVRVRDRECAVPWCHRPARHCDYDHEAEWVRDGGDTSTANSGPKCRSHHGRKDDPRWVTHYDPVHGTMTITTPSGATYTGRREPVMRPRTDHELEDQALRSMPRSKAGDECVNAPTAK
ncbi:hypothetical protein BJF85_01625 [Saccharomonospora sp. CUA-673]|nr:hypothetical protein BJF85_01625 [Saccharomonospora sp. CUA-673]